MMVCVVLWRRRKMGKVRRVATRFFVDIFVFREAFLRSSLFFRRFYLPLLLALCAAYAFRPIGPGYDFWAHAAIGRWIWNHKAVPESSLFLWGAPIPWVAHSWLSQLFFYALIQFGGGWTPHGNVSVGTGPLVVMAFTTLVACAVWTLLWRLWNWRSWRNGVRVPIAFLTPIFFALAIWASAPRFQPRQEMLTALILTILLSYLINRHAPDDELSAASENTLYVENSPEEIAVSRASSTRSARKSWLGAPEIAIVALFALWVNLHALVLLGLLFLVVTAICDAVQDRFDKRSRALLLLAVACAAATLINPFGFRWLEAATQLKAGNMANSIEEWKPPLEARNLWPYVGVEFILAASALVAWAFAPKRRWAHAVWVMLMAILFLKQRRHLWLAALVFLAVTAANSGFFDSRRWWGWWKHAMKEPDAANQPIPLGMRRIAQGGMIACLVLWLTFQVGTVPFSMVSRYVPEGASYALEQGQKNGTLPRGHLVNDYANSSYLQWRLNHEDARGIVPTRGVNPLYIDLINAYPDGPNGLLNEYFGVIDATKAGLRVLDTKGVNIVYLPRVFDKKRLAIFLDKSPVWRRVYQKRDGTLWARRQPLPIKPLN